MEIKKVAKYPENYEEFEIKRESIDPGNLQLSDEKINFFLKTTWNKAFTNTGIGTNASEANELIADLKKLESSSHIELEAFFLKSKILFLTENDFAVIKENISEAIEMIENSLGKFYIQTNNIEKFEKLFPKQVNKVLS